MRLTVTPLHADAVPGERLVLTVSVTNTTSVISGHVVRVLGVDPRWVELSEERLSLFPGTTGTCEVALTLPPGLLAGRRRVSVQVRELTGAGRAEVVDVDLTLPEVRGVEARLEPSTVTAGRRGSFGLLVTNTGNAPLATVLAGSDEEERVRFRFTPDRLDLDPGEHAVVEVDVRARRPVVGALAVRPLLLSVTQADRPGEPALAAANGSLLQRPLVGRPAFSLLGLLAAVTVFALVITYALSGVVGRSAADRDLALQVAAASDAQDEAGVGTATLTGTARLLTAGTPVSGVTVELVGAADTSNVLATTATAEDGTWSLRGVAGGSYKVRFRGAGFAELWFPAALGEAEASAVDVQPGARKEGLDVRLGGLPAGISGKVAGTDVGGAQVSLLLPGTPTEAVATAGRPGTGSPVVQVAEVGADGGFALTGVPSPGVYDLAVTKAGFATTVERLDVAGGEQRTGVALELVDGDGVLAGTVRGERGPLVGASVSVEHGTSTLRTVTGPGGVFEVAGLPTPQTVLLTVSAAEHAAQTLSLSLAPAQRLTGLTVALGGSAGAVRGTVRTDDGAPAGGVSVLLTDGTLSLQTVTSSTPAPAGSTLPGIGSWALGGLPVPGTYTVTYARPDLVPQTVGLSLDAFGRVVGGSDQRVVLRSATVDLAGAVRLLDAAGGVVRAGLPPITVTLVSASTRYTVRAATVPLSAPGGWRLDGVAPGTYTLTATARGSRPSSRVVSFRQGQEPPASALRLDLRAPASITVTVQDVGRAPSAGATVRLFLATGYPGTVLATAVTGEDGVVRFPGLDAPQRYVVDYAPPGGESQQTRTVDLAESADAQLLLGEGR